MIETMNMANHFSASISNVTEELSVNGGFQTLKPIFLGFRSSVKAKSACLTACHITLLEKNLSIYAQIFSLKTSQKCFKLKVALKPSIAMQQKTREWSVMTTCIGLLAVGMLITGMNA